MELVGDLRANRRIILVERAHLVADASKHAAPAILKVGNGSGLRLSTVAYIHTSLRFELSTSSNIDTNSGLSIGNWRSICAAFSSFRLRNSASVSATRRVISSSEAASAAAARQGAQGKPSAAVADVGVVGVGTDVV